MVYQEMHHGLSGDAPWSIRRCILVGSDITRFSLEPLYILGARNSKIKLKEVFSLCKFFVPHQNRRRQVRVVVRHFSTTSGP